MAFRTNKTPVLQEKTASGSVASFNTALAMPLASCNIAVNAWQEGSGDPSPSNVRPIHGFSVLNATRAGKNIANIKTYNDWVNIGAYAINQYCLPNNTLLIMSLVDKDPTIDLTGVFFGYIAGNYDGSALQARDYYWVINNGSIGNRKTNISLSGSNLLNSLFFYPTTEGTFNKIFSRYDIQIEVGSTATDYEQYTGNTYTIQLGQEVYGAEVDMVNGVAHVTHEYLEPAKGQWQGKDGAFFYTRVWDELIFTGAAWKTGISNKFIPRVGTASAGEWWFNPNGRIVISTTDSYSTVAEMYEAIGSISFVCELATPFDIQLTPTQIETLIGNNTIFADTGDVDLTYNDLDLAKRGSFREVFKLPS